ncbi:MAG: VOC family protein [Bacteroidetes bacterium]|nr:VOC family protein [Bacteroidota bacterium]
MPFHLAVPVSDLERTADFYKEVLSCREGRSSESWKDLDFFGHQLVLHKSGKAESDKSQSNSVDGHDVPIPHFGIVLEYEDWFSMEKKLKESGIKFIIEPYVRFMGQTGEQATMFFYDPSGNAIELKAFRDPEQLFAH